MNEYLTYNRSTTRMAPSVGAISRVPGGHSPDHLRNGDRSRSESGGLRTSVPADWASGSSWSGISAGQDVGSQGRSATSAPALTTGPIGWYLGDKVNRVKNIWENRMAHAERVWVVFCVTGTFAIVLIDFARGNL